MIVSLSQIIDIAHELGYYDKIVTGSVNDYLKIHYNIDIDIEQSTGDYILSFMNKRHEMFFKLKYSHILKKNT